MAESARWGRSVLVEKLRLLIVSPWQERCGNVVYTENLVRGLSQFPVRITVVHSVSDPWEMDWGSYDVAVFNYISGMTMHTGWPQAFMGASTKRVLIHQGTTPGGNRSPFTDAFEAVVVHHKDVESEAPNFHYIPHGILEVPGDEPPPNELVIGSAGFPQPFKGLMEICRAADLISECRVLLVMPESRHADALGMAVACREILPQREKLEIIHGWLTDTEVGEVLRRASVCAFGHIEEAPGVSGCVRMGIAAKRPVIVPDLWHFKDIRDQAYLCDVSNPEELAGTLRQAHEGGKDTWSGLISGMSWSAVAGAYYDLFGSIL